jgi:hypothetical protein
MPRHRPALAHDVKTHRELSAGEGQLSGVGDEWKGDRVAPDPFAGRDRDPVLAAEADGLVRAGNDGGAVQPQADEDPVESDWPNPTFATRP